MNKISKKIVALATMAAFVLTLVPAAAFAVEPGPEGATKVEVTKVDYNTANVTVTVGGYDLDETQNIVVWATDADGVVPLTEVEYTPVDGSEEYPGSQNWDQAIVLNNPDAANGTVSVDATFTVEGDYVLHAAINEDGASDLAALVAAGMEIGEGTAFETLYASADASQYGVYVDDVFQTEAEVAVNTDLTTTFKVNDRYTDKADDTLDNVVIWAVNVKTKQVTELSKVTAVSGLTANGTDYAGKAYKFTNVGNNAQVKVQFSAPGDYVLYAGEGTLYSAANDAKIGDSFTTVKVTDNTEVDSMEISAYINGSDTKYEMEFDEDANTYKLDLTEATGFKFNGIDYVTLSGVAKEADGTGAKNQTINFTVNEPNTVVRLNPTSDNTSNDGEFQTVFKMESQKNAVITITEPNSGVSYDVLVIAQKTSATDIDCTKTGGYVLATTDDQWTEKVNANFGTAVQFMVTDEKGDAVEGLANSAFKLDVEGKPKATSSLETSDLEVVEIGDGLYTLGVKADEVAKDNKLLTEGKYEVRVALNGVDTENDNIGVTFTAAEFGKVEDVELNITANDVALDDQITLGTTADVSLVYVDGNGVQIAGPTDFSWNATNSALAIQSTDNHKLVMKPNTIEHQGVVGSTVLVQASVPKYGLVEKELTIVSTYNTYSMEFDPAEGPVNEYNKVDLSVLNSDGDVAKNINGDIKIVVADSSNEDAKVSVKQAKAVKNGEGALTVYASQETELELVVTVEKDGKILAADTLNYTVGAADPLAGRTVVMTVDSTEYVVNNNIITGDAAPYIDSAWRTMVPIRALAEAFDAEVYWNQDDETVTINFDAGTKIVMTVDETTYTVNGEEATMDTEPVNTGSRVYVPIRFAAEAMGFHVTPLYNDAGLTASVVFQR